MLAKAKIVSLDSSTLGIVARDFWSKEESLRRKAANFVSSLTEQGVFIAFTATHICELIKHENSGIVRGRIEFLSRLPLIAWLRPYDRNWLPGCAVDVIVREIEAYLRNPSASWEELTATVRSDFWETGNGSEMFVQPPAFWKFMRLMAQEQHARQIHVASLARVRVGGVSNMTMEQARKMPRRSRSEFPTFSKEFTREVHRQLVVHGDQRLEQKERVAVDFAVGTFRRIEGIDPEIVDPFQMIVQRAGIPAQLVGPNTTVDEIGELAVYVEQLRLLGELLVPPRKLTPLDIPITALPAYVLERGLNGRQQRAEHVDGSDLGDSHIASLLLYADALEVDKRTHHHLEHLQRRNRKLGSLMCPFFKVGDYSKIPDRLAT